MFRRYADGIVGQMRDLCRAASSNSPRGCGDSTPWRTLVSAALARVQLTAVADPRTVVRRRTADAIRWQTPEGGGGRRPPYCWEADYVPMSTGPHGGDGDTRTIVSTTEQQGSVNNICTLGSIFLFIRGWDTVCWQSLCAGCVQHTLGCPAAEGRKKWGEGEDRTERLHFRGGGQDRAAALPRRAARAVPSRPTACGSATASSE